MPKTQSKISTAELREDRMRLVRLQQIGIATGDARDSAVRYDGFSLSKSIPNLPEFMTCPAAKSLLSH